ncbi:hypothetical protein [Photobacterium kagoshimensis]|uniref:hypothetical protein n=1 Tax=Photobacterium kagoshimensis TaxID=2910242 RepID=UPI003D12CAD8
MAFSQQTNMMNTAANGINQIGNEILGAIREGKTLSGVFSTIEKNFLPTRQNVQFRVNGVNEDKEGIPRQAEITKASKC